MSENRSEPAISGTLVLLCVWCSEKNGIPTPRRHGLYERRTWTRVIRWWECSACGNWITPGVQILNQDVSE
jgi:hypothetical protein